MTTEILSTDIAYVAGQVDADGCISMYMHKENYVHIHVQISSQDAEMLDWVIERFGGYRHVNNKKAPACWIWNPSDKWEFLRTILPYLKTKKVQAELALEYRAWSGDGKISHGNGEEAIAKKQEFVDRCKNLNGRLPAIFKEARLNGEIIT